MTSLGIMMAYVSTREVTLPRKKKKWCAVVQTYYRENDTQYVYADCAYESQPEPYQFTHGIGLHYPIIPQKEVDYQCENICEDEIAFLAKTTSSVVPSHMQPVTSSNEKSTRYTLVFPHRNKPPFKQPLQTCLADRYILEQFHTLPYEGLDYIQSCLSFETILDKLDTTGLYPHNTKARATALHLLLHLPPEISDALEEQPTSERVRNRVYLSATGKHSRLLTPRCDTSIVEKLGITNAITLLQKSLRGRVMQLSMEKTCKRWEESYEELNGFGISYQSDPYAGLELVTFPTYITIVRTVAGQYIAPILEPLVKPGARPTGALDTSLDGLGTNESQDSELLGQLIIHK